MKVGINGMGRIGRLALRAAMGEAERQADDPRAGNYVIVTAAYWGFMLTDGALRMLALCCALTLALPSKS